MNPSTCDNMTVVIPTAHTIACFEDVTTGAGIDHLCNLVLVLVRRDAPALPGGAVERTRRDIADRKRRWIRKRLIISDLALGDADRGA